MLVSLHWLMSLQWWRTSPHRWCTQVQEASTTTGAMSAAEVARQLAGWRRWLHSLDPHLQLPLLTGPRDPAAAAAGDTASPPSSVHASSGGLR